MSILPPRQHLVLYYLHKPGGILIISYLVIILYQFWFYYSKTKIMLSRNIEYIIEYKYISSFNQHRKMIFLFMHRPCQYH